ncbi:hypothetical protein ABGB12_15330 [Actinocorallia sp. B10E7]|uniref:hypothetical protein n=1 Tax=Actinocorallia sp. B10E7 TaxID=3153558 RepID=UPI00325CDE60
MPAALLTLFADAMFWDVSLALAALGMWAVAAVCWMILALRYALQKAEVETPVLAVIAPVLLVVVLTVASTDLASRAALSVSRTQLEEIAASAPAGEHDTNVRAGLYQITWTSKDEDGTRLSADLFDPDADGVLGLLGGADSLFGDDCILIRLDEAQRKKSGDRFNHLSGDWYCDCKPEIFLD